MKKIYGYVFVPNIAEPVDISKLNLQAETLAEAEILVQAVCKKLNCKRYLITI